MTGIINAQNQVERVQTWIDQPIVGDMLVETTYSGYKDFGGVMFPSRIVQTQDGFPSLDLTISSVTANPAGRHHRCRTTCAARSPPPVRVESQKLADGVFYLTGGTHHSLAVEMKDHIVLVDTPQTEAAGAGGDREGEGGRSRTSRSASSSPRIITGIISAASARRSTKAPRSSRTSRTRRSSSASRRRRTRSIRTGSRRRRSR